MTTKYVKPPLQPLQYARNGKYPDAAYQTQLAELANHLSSFRMKEIVSFGMTTTIIASAPDSSDRIRWRTRYRASPYVRAVAVRAIMAQSIQTLGELETEQPAHCKVEFIRSAAATVGIADLYYGNAAAEASRPDDCAVLDTWVNWDPDVAPLGEVIWGPTAGDLYDVVVTDTQSRIMSLTIFEIPLTFEMPFSEGYATKTPILDTDRSELTAYARQAWKTQAAPLFTWTVDDQGVPRSTFDATDTNLIDNSSTTVSGATPGFTIDLRNRARVNAATVPCELHAYGTCDGASFPGHVYLKDSSGTVLATVTINLPGPAWFSTTVDLPATLAKYDLHFDTTAGTHETTVGAVWLAQYQSGA